MATTKHQPRALVDVYASLVVGATQACIFNPWDRALYLSVKNGVPFLNKANWVHPFQGFAQAAVHRTLSGGLYFCLQGVVEDMFAARDVVPSRFVVGALAGALNGAALNPLSVVKYHCWGKEGASFVSSAVHLMKTGGISGFNMGIVATTTRDTIFGCVYESSRKALRGMAPDQGVWRLVSDMNAAAFATACSSPVNYARNMKYAALADGTPLPSVATSLRGLVENTRLTAKEKGFGASAVFVQRRLQLGWGTARVGIGIGFGQALFDWTKQVLLAMEPESQRLTNNTI